MLGEFGEDDPGVVVGDDVGVAVFLAVVVESGVVPVELLAGLD